MVLAACGPGGDTAGGRGSNGPTKVDREQFEAVRSELERIRTDAFTAAARAVEGEARPGTITLVPCELKGEGVGRLQLSGSLLYSDLDGAASAAAVRDAWDRAGRTTEQDAESLSSSTTVRGVRVSLVADEPIAVEQGPAKVLRRLKAGSGCMDLGSDLYDEVR